MKGAGVTCRWLVVLALVAVAPAAAAFKNVEVGQEAPHFTLRSLTGEAYHLEEKVGVKALAVVFWASWSPRSQPLLRDLEALYRERRDQGFEVVAVNVEHEEIGPEDRAAVAAVATTVSYPVLLDPGLGTYNGFGVVATPSLALLDEQGVVRYVRASYSTSARQEIREAVDALLGLKEGGSQRHEVVRRKYVPPRQATLRYQKALVLVRRGMARKAIRDLETASRLDPNWSEPCELLATVYRHEARRQPKFLAKAEAVLRKARAIRPEHLPTLAALGEVLEERGSYPEALRVAGEALALEPAYTPALLVKTRSFLALGRVSEASAVVEEAFALDPRNPLVLMEKGEVAAISGRWEEAAEDLRKAAEIALAAQLREEG